MITKVSNQFLYKYQPSSGQSSSLLMKASCLRLKLVELNFFPSFTTDDQSIFNVSSHNMLQKPIKIQNSHKGTTLDIKMNKSTVHKLIGSNKLVANKRKRFMDLITTLLAFPEMVLTQNTINCCFGLPNCYNHDKNIKYLSFYTNTRIMT